MAKEKIGLNKVFEESLKDSQPLHGLSETYKANFKSESEELQLYFDDNSDGRSKRSTPQHNLEISDDPTTESEAERELDGPLPELGNHQADASSCQNQV